jgi:hypothetical protein
MENVPMIENSAIENLAVLDEAYQRCMTEEEEARKAFDAIFPPGTPVTHESPEYKAYLAAIKATQKALEALADQSMISK